MNKKHIAVLKGGLSAEREVSLNSGAACAKALRELGHQVTEIDVGADLAEKLAKAKPDVVFNALHGQFGEDGCVQGLLELMQIPYTHSGVLASAVAMDKPMAKVMFEAAGIRCPKGKTLSYNELLQGDPLPRPFVVKPACEGSSVGVHIVRKEDNRPLNVILQGGEQRVEGDMNKPVANPLPPSAYLAEEYIAGHEITVAVLNGKALGVTEIRPKSGFYDYTNKYTDGKSEHLCPAPLPADKLDEVKRLAEKAHAALGCRGLTRSDFRYDDTNGKSQFYMLEINTQPGMTALSLSPEIAAHAGISFNNLVQMLIDDAKLGN